MKHFKARLINITKTSINKIMFRVLSVINKILPKNKKLIFMTCKGYFGWNGIALAQYLDKEGYLDKYKLICYVDDLDFVKKKYSSYSKIVFTNNTIRGYWARLRCKYYFSGVLGERFACKPGNKQISVQMWHGIALKALVYTKKRQYMLKSFTHALCYSEFVAEIMKKDWNFDDSKVLLSQNPRDDWMFSGKDCFSMFDIPTDRKTVMWLPTFRNNTASQFFDSNIDFPLLNDKLVCELDRYLKDCNINLVIKLHPLQREIGFLHGDFSNIYLLENKDFDNSECEFYEMLGQADALLSDYSSVAIDFMLLDRPLGYVIDDIGEYDSRRGFHVDDPLKFMPGHHISNFEELKVFLKDIENGADVYREERHKINNVLNKYQDGANCKRVLDAVGIYKD